MKMVQSVLFLLIGFISVQYVFTKIETYTFDTFPKDKVAVHMPCEESNMFATKCMCHLKCTDSSCNNAKELCEKYEQRYVLSAEVAVIFVNS